MKTYLATVALLVRAPSFHEALSQLGGIVNPPDPATGAAWTFERNPETVEAREGESGADALDRLLFRDYASNTPTSREIRREMRRLEARQAALREMLQEVEDDLDRKAGVK